MGFKFYVLIFDGLSVIVLIFFHHGVGIGHFLYGFLYLLDFFLRSLYFFLFFSLFGRSVHREILFEISELLHDHFGHVNLLASLVLLEEFIMGQYQCIDDIRHVVSLDYFATMQ